MNQFLSLKNLEQSSERALSISEGRSPLILAPPFPFSRAQAGVFIHGIGEIWAYAFTFRVGNSFCASHLTLSLIIKQTGVSLAKT